MRRRSGRIALTLVATCAIAVCFLLHSAYVLVGNSQTFDEAVHAAAGHRYLAHQEWTFNREHPPLTKLLSALPAFLFYDSPPFDPTSNQWPADRAYLYASTEPAKRLLMLARLSNVMLGALTVALIAYWSWQLWGAAGALLSSSLAAFDPNLLAHSGVATTDIGATFFFLLTLYLLWRYIREAGWTSLALVGIALGGALASKFSTITLLPTAAVVLFALPFMTRSQAEPTNMSAQRFIATTGAFAVILLVAELTLWMCYFGGDLTVWLDGFRDQMQHQGSGHPAFLWGSYSTLGWFWYFPVAFLIKTPLATLIALVCMLANYRRLFSTAPELRLVIGSALLLFALAACLSRVNIGIRHILPGYALMFVPIGGLATLRFRDNWSRLLVCGALIGGAAIESLSVMPHQLAFFNMAVGGPSQGHKYLSDSSLDWGQDLAALSDWLDIQGNPTIYLSYFGTAPPESFRIRYQYLPTFGNSPPKEAWHVPFDENRQLLAVSVTNLQGTYLTEHAMYHWLFERTPIARIGYSIWVYDISGDADAHRRLEQIYRRVSMPELADRELEEISQIPN